MTSSDTSRIDNSAAGEQIIGARELQEDAFAVSHPTLGSTGASALLAIVADGIGGHGGGDVASRIAVESFAASMTASLGGADAGGFADFDIGEDIFLEPAEIPGAARGSADAAAFNVPTLFNLALTQANLDLADAKIRSPQLASMGSTFVAALIENGKLWWVSVGDSHLYLVRQNKLEKKNALHTYGEFLDAQTREGQTVEDAGDRERKRLTSSLDGEDIALIDCAAEPLVLQAGDVVILASDGLNALTEARIVFAVTAADSAQACAAELLKAVEALAHPKQDNTTVVVIRYGKSETEERPVDEIELDFGKTLQPQR
jgi:PPM family protein phosphatase